MANAKKWLRIIDQLPPENLEVETKIDDDKGKCCERTLIRIGREWYLNGRKVKIAVSTPTHWRYKK